MTDIGGNNVKRDDLLYPELSYQINGILFEVSNALGGGHRESYYERAIMLACKKRGLACEQQVYVPVLFHGEKIGSYYVDLVIEQSIVVELKRGTIVPATVIRQTAEYLDALNKKLGLIACFTYNGVTIKRVVNHRLLS